MIDETRAHSEAQNGRSPARRVRRGCLTLALILLAGALLPLGWRAGVKWAYAAQIVAPSAVPAPRVAIVYGAAVYRNGRLSTVLRDRMDTAIALYHAGAVNRLLVSGDNRDVHYNEPDAMRAYAISRGVPAADVVADPAGLRTYDTCYRARHVYGVDEAVLVTQAFHLPRALFTCRNLGVDAVGVAADLRPYRAARWYELRETAATLVALWDVVRQQPATIMRLPDGV